MNRFLSDHESEELQSMYQNARSFSEFLRSAQSLDYVSGHNDIWLAAVMREVADLPGRAMSSIAAWEKGSISDAELERDIEFIRELRDPNKA
jgi:hypothetical protein